MPALRVLKRLYARLFSPEAVDAFGHWYNDRLPWTIPLIPALWVQGMLGIALASIPLLFSLTPIFAIPFGVERGILFLSKHHATDLAFCGAWFVYAAVTGPVVYRMWRKPGEPSATVEDDAARR